MPTNEFKNKVYAMLYVDNNLTDARIDETCEDVRCMRSFRDLTDEEVDRVKAEIKSEQAVRLDDVKIVVKGQHTRWFLDRKGLLTNSYWNRYREYLRLDKHYSDSVVNSMESVIDDLTDLLGDPENENGFNRKGLVIGDVQSGKTANYTGLICRAADAGYRVVVLLTGTIESLRQQTQGRIDEGFLGYRSEAIYLHNVTGDPRIGVGSPRYDDFNEGVLRPHPLTDNHNDFNSTRFGGMPLDSHNCPVIFVIKKNSHILQNLNDWFTNPFNANALRTMPLLMIDDEADNASINTNNNPDESPTAINGKIREILNLFAKSSYVGFTATPYANVFIEPDTEEDLDKPENLFPKDYIYCLNAPSNYYGCRDIFNPDGKAAHMLVRINDDENDPESIQHTDMLPLKHKITQDPQELPEDLKTAIATFLLANAIEDLDGLTGNHRSMLINVSRFTDIQQKVEDLVRDELKSFQNEIDLHSGKPVEQALNHPYLKRLYDTYISIYQNSVAEDKQINYSWDEIQSALKVSCAPVMIHTFNSADETGFDYEAYPNGARVIAIGGFSLSRGLTLEGLVTSYFYRNSKAYDTLMQMGRWFGYREKYDKVCRIFIHQDGIDAYQDIGDATDELRDDLRKNQNTNLTPLQFAIRIRNSKLGMLITARNKMRRGMDITVYLNLSGEVLESPKVIKDEQDIENKKQQVKDFVSLLVQKGYEPYLEKDKGFRNIPKKFIVDFLLGLRIINTNPHFDVKAITDFLSSHNEEKLENWDVAFITGDSKAEFDFGNGFKFHGTTRTFKLSKDLQTINIYNGKGLATPENGQIMLDEESVDRVKDFYRSMGRAFPMRAFFGNGIDRKPILLIYPVELKEPKNPEKDTAENKEWYGKTVIGFCIGIPTISGMETKTATYTYTPSTMNLMGFDDDEN